MERNWCPVSLQKDTPLSLFQTVPGLSGSVRLVVYQELSVRPGALHLHGLFRVRGPPSSIRLPETLRNFGTRNRVGQDRGSDRDEGGVRREGEVLNTDTEGCDLRYVRAGGEKRARRGGRGPLQERR